MPLTLALGLARLKVAPRLAMEPEAGALSPLWCLHDECVASLQWFGSATQLARHVQRTHAATHPPPPVVYGTHVFLPAADAGAQMPPTDAWMPFGGAGDGDRVQRARFKKHWLDLVAMRGAWLRDRAWREPPLIDAILRGAGRAEFSKRRRMRFDVLRHRLRETFAAMIGVPADELHALHTRLPGFQTSSTHLKDKSALLAPMCDRNRRAKFAAAYDAWMLAVAVPDAASVYEKAARAVGLPEAHSVCTEVLFQSFPCVRVSLPSDFALIKPHTDALYHHAWGTLNYYVPLTPTIGATNSLQLESAPFLYDFKPLELNHGECERFAGALFAHYTVANRTGVTRVSFDGAFRALSAARALRAVLFSVHRFPGLGGAPSIHAVCAHSFTTVPLTGLPMHCPLAACAFRWWCRPYCLPMQDALSHATCMTRNPPSPSSRAPKSQRMP